MFLLKYCGALTKKDLESNELIICDDEFHKRRYTINNEAKSKIISGIIANGINVNNIDWIGEARTCLINGSLEKFGYSSFIKED